MKNIVIAGKNDISVHCLEILLDNNDIEVVGVITHPDDLGEDCWQKSLTKAAKERNLNVYQPKNINDLSFIRKLTGLKPDILISFQYGQILKKEVLNVPKICLNLHFAPLPKYRGVAPIAWALINGEKEFGVTIHIIDEGIDTGDIVFQKLFKIEDKDNGRTLYDKCIYFGVELFKKTFPDIINGDYSIHPQDNKIASYYKKGTIDFLKNKIDWNNTTNQLFNWIRAFIFPPFQYPITFHKGKEIKISKLIPDFSKNKYDKCGKIIDINDSGIRVKTNDGSIIIKKVVENNKEIDTSIYAQKNKLKIGDVFN